MFKSSKLEMQDLIGQCNLTRASLKSNEYRVLNSYKNGSKKMAKIRNFGFQGVI